MFHLSLIEILDWYPQRVQIRRKVDIEEKKDFAKKLSGVKERE